ncbi:DegT/DnrJ/EryC1/StrS aminotransferase family protein [Azoarcus sp. KH32C]|uniref:DegT/DnrJ/EryC1/StrS family aminotransferase n=1 Tax=Azoarcus sp. KH32C TaxID=748247 RepID=UPI00023866AF|nr:DegT/DnrJ/EryC1/StrS family aminotransferase [Azoarcus sp. KH32C]BAL22592.1 perosamine synthetase [Azoarcus sp. KH32C]
MKRISVAEPKFGGKEREYVLDCMDSTWISSAGKYITAFEETFARFCGVRHAIATNNGTTALHLALVALGLKPGDEVLIPTVTYIATANAVRYCGAEPVLLDVCPDTMNIDPAELERRLTPKTKGIIPVHLYGHPAEMEPIMAFARRHNLFVLEDAAEAHGAEYQGKKVGTFGDCATFSFFGNKIVTTGEGGMVTTNDDDLAAHLRLLRGQGMDPKRRYWFPEVGYNYRMTNIQAAIGLAQMENIDQALAERQRLAGWYNEALAPLATDIVLPATAPWAHHVFWMYTVFLRTGGEERRNAIMRALDEQGIETRPVFYPMHVLPPYQQPSSFPVADLWSHRGINLPTHQLLSRDDVQRIAEALKVALAAS